MHLRKMVEPKDIKRYKRFKLRNVLKALLVSRSKTDGQRLILEPVKRSNFKRTVYILTTVIAFVLGICVGVLIPFVLLPKISIAIEDKSLTRNVLLFNYTIDVRDNESYLRRVVKFYDNNERKTKNQSRPFHRVSFISNVTTSILPSSSHKYVSSTFRTFSTTDATNSAKILDVSSRKLLDGIFWSQEMENILPWGYDNSDADNWRNYLRTVRVSKLDIGCGRMQNRLVTFDDGSQACVRYRQNTDQIQGELFSFYLGRLLQLRNLAPSSLSTVRMISDQWITVKPQILLARWSEGKPIILTKYIDDLRPAHIPEQFRSNSRRFHPSDLKGDDGQLVELAQWSDLIIFDYLTANLDRIVNNLYNLQWNPGMMEAPAHNLAKTTDDNLLLFMDNESGLLHGYRLLDKYEAYHSILLESLCVFRKPTIEVLERLRVRRNIGMLLNENLLSLHGQEVLPVLPEKSIKILNQRINRVLDQVSWCQRQYMNLSNNAR